MFSCKNTDIRIFLPKVKTNISAEDANVSVNIVVQNSAMGEGNAVLITRVTQSGPSSSKGKALPVICRPKFQFSRMNTGI
jgi:hypothetical protein